MNRADLSQFLIHLTKEGTYERYQPQPGPPPGYERVYRTVSAKASLIGMIQIRRIEARSPFGYFKLKINQYRRHLNRVFFNGGADPDWMKAVCFSEAPLSELKDFYTAVTMKRNRYQKYGLAFWQERARALGANPIFYVDSRRPDLVNALDTSLNNNLAEFIPAMHLMETFGPPVVPGAAIHSDFRWEREWRKRDDLTFGYADLAFGICPMAEIQYFEGLTNSSVTFIDPDWTAVQLKAYLATKDPVLCAHF